MAKRDLPELKYRKSRCDANSHKAHVRQVKDGMIKKGIRARTYGCNRKIPELALI